MRNWCAVVVSFLVVWGFLEVLCQDDRSFEMIKPFLQNKEFMARVLNCVKDDHKCSRFGRDIKDKLGTAYRTHCEDCTDKEKSMAKKIAVFLNGTGDWDTLLQAFDPENTYRQEFETFLGSLDTNLSAN